MIQIDYMGILNDLGIKEKLIDIIQKESNLNKSDIEKMYHDKVQYHAQKMDSYLDKYLTNYLNLKSNNENDVDAKLDQMVNEYLQKNQQVK